MSRLWRWSLLGALALLMIVGFQSGDPRRELTRTSFGTIPPGYGAAFELFNAMGLPVTRSYRPVDRLPRDVPVWWITPRGLCDSAAAPPPEGADGWRGGEWLDDGGTALVFLAPATSACDSIAGIPVPKRRGDDQPPPEPGHGEAEEPPLAAAEASAVKQRVGGDLVALPRSLMMPPVSVFEDAGDWSVRATVDDRPFVLERVHGRGRLIVVADASFLQNQWLDHADAALVAADLVRAFGVPVFDEYEHGMRAEGSTLRYLATSAALPVFLGLAALGLLFAWRGRAMPPRAVRQETEAAPTLETFVDSVAALYAQTRDHARVLQRYREVTAARLRRHFGLPPETALSAVAERLRRDRRTSPAVLDRLTSQPVVAHESELRAAVRALDALVEEALR